MSLVNKIQWRDVIEIIFMALIGYLYFIFYLPIGHWASLRGFTINQYILTPFDQRIYFEKYWIVFYVISNIMPLLTILLVLYRSHWNMQLVRQFFFTVLILLSVSYIFYLAFPSNTKSIFMQSATVLPDVGIINKLAIWEFNVTTWWNSLPSFHVSLGWVCFRYYADYFRTSKWLFLAWFILMCVSTLTLRMHYLLDVVTGWLLGEIIFYAFARKYNLYQTKMAQFLLAGNRFMITYTFVLIILAGILSQTSAADWQTIW